MKWEAKLTLAGRGGCHLQGSSCRSTSPMCTTATCPRPWPPQCPPWCTCAGRVPMTTQRTLPLWRPIGVWRLPPWVDHSSSALPKERHSKMVGAFYKVLFTQLVSPKGTWKDSRYSTVTNGYSLYQSDLVVLLIACFRIFFHLKLVKLTFCCVCVLLRCGCRVWSNVNCVTLTASMNPVCFLSYSMNTVCLLSFTSRSVPWLGSPHSSIGPAGAVLAAGQGGPDVRLHARLEGSEHGAALPRPALHLQGHQGPLQMGREPQPWQRDYGESGVGGLGVRGGHQPGRGRGAEGRGHGVPAGTCRVESLPDGRRSVLLLQRGCWEVWHRPKGRRQAVTAHGVSDLSPFLIIPHLAKQGLICIWLMRSVR